METRALRRCPAVGLLRLVLAASTLGAGALGAGCTQPEIDARRNATGDSKNAKWLDWIERLGTGFVRCGEASTYGWPGDTNCEGRVCAGGCTASGEIMNPTEPTAACPAHLVGWRRGVEIGVWPRRGGGEGLKDYASARCTDTGSFGEPEFGERILDVSPQLWRALFPGEAAGVADVCYVVLGSLRITPDASCQ